jgi:FixJ family two-component response regulator/glycine cleavage system H lipoate-binding protein
LVKEQHLLSVFHLTFRDKKKFMTKTSDILVIDDEQVVIDAVIKICSLDNYSVDTASTVTQALEKIGHNKYGIIISDIMMPDGDGFQVLDELHNRNVDSAIIMMTGFSTVENAVNSLYKGAIDFIPKPFTVDELLNSVFRANKYQKIKVRQEQMSMQKRNGEILYVNCPAKYFRLGYSSWMYQERDGSVLTGVCDLFLKTIDSVKEIEFAEPESEIVQGISCSTITSGDERVHKILSPVSGRIVEVNNNLKTNSSLVEKDPYFEGWMYRVIPMDIGYEQKLLTPCSSDRL